MEQALSNANATRTDHTLELMKQVPPLAILGGRGLIYYGCAANRWGFLEQALSSATPDDHRSVSAESVRR